MNKTTLLTALRNLSLLVLVAFPLFLLTLWMQALVGGTERSRDLGYVLETGAFYYLSYVFYVLLGGVAHQILMFLLLGPWSKLRRRAAAILLTPVIPLVLIALGERSQTIVAALLPIFVSLGIYGLLVKFPETADQPTGWRTCQYPGTGGT